MDLEHQKELWRKEQLLIASQVEIFPDPPLLTLNQCPGRFQPIPLLNSSASQYSDDAITMSSGHDLSIETTYCSYYGGVDVSFPSNESDASVAVYVILQYPTGKIVYQDFEYFHLQVPYISSYLAFREIDPLDRLIQKQIEKCPQLTPRAILVDGNGILHPRKAGIACFVGIRTGLPTIGVGKTLFCEGKLTKDIVLRQLEASLKDAGDCALNGMSPNSNKIVLLDQQSIPRSLQLDCAVTQDVTDTQTLPTDRTSLVKDLAPVCGGLAVPLTNEDGETVACALVAHGGIIGSKATAYPHESATAATAAAVVGAKNPIYISVGHKISLQESVIICASFSFSKIPEPVRQADLIGRNLMRIKDRKK